MSARRPKIRGRRAIVVAPRGMPAAATSSPAPSTLVAPRTRKRSRLASEQPLQPQTDAEQDRERAHRPSRHQPRRRTTNADAAAGNVDNMKEGALTNAASVVPRAAASAAERCDSNSLSLVFACLNSHDFASAMKVSRQWRSTAQVNTAWPSFSLPRLIHQLQKDDYDNPAHRRIRVKNHNVRRVLSSSVYSKVNDVVLTPSSISAGSLKATHRALLQLARLPHLTAINCTLERPIGNGLDEFAAVMANRLRVLVFSIIDPRNLEWMNPLPSLDGLGQLSQLRVLVVNLPPTPADLMRLVHLEYLHVSHRHAVSPSLTHAIRYLSAQHRLRTVSLECSQLYPESDAYVFLAILSLAQKFWPTLYEGIIRSHTNIEDQLAIESEDDDDDDEGMDGFVDHFPYNSDDAAEDSDSEDGHHSENEGEIEVEIEIEEEDEDEDDGFEDEYDGGYSSGAMDWSEEDEEDEEMPLVLPTLVGQVPLLPADAPTELPPAALTELSITRAYLSTESFESLCHMPSLVRLECSVDDNDDEIFGTPESWAATTRSCLQRLTHLKLTVVGCLSGLSVCTTLRSLYLDFGQSTAENLTWIAELPLLESLTIRGDLHSQVHLPSESTWTFLRQCTRLQRFNFGVLPTTPLALLTPHLITLPEFRELRYVVWPWRQAIRLESSFAVDIARSASWLSLHLELCGPIVGGHESSALDLEGSSAQLRKSPAKNDAVNARFRVFDHAVRSEAVYRIGRDARGRRAWVVTE